MVVAQIGVRQHIVAQPLAGAQAAAVADHQPHMRAQHGQMVGRRLGVGRADADVDQGDAVAPVAHQVVGGHLRQLGQGGPRRLFALAGDAVARFHEAFVAAGVDLLAAELDEFVHIALVVGEQHELLEMLRVGGGVVAQPVQRIVDPLGREQRQRHGAGGPAAAAAVDDGVVGGGQVGQVEMLLQLLALLAGQLGGGALQREGQRDRLVAAADVEGGPMVLDEQRHLLQKIVAEQGRRGDGRAMQARRGHLAERQVAALGDGSGCDLGAQIGVDGRRHARLQLARGEGLEFLLGGGQPVFVDLDDAVQRLLRRGAGAQVDGGDVVQACRGRCRACHHGCSCCFETICLRRVTKTTGRWPGPHSSGWTGCRPAPLSGPSGRSRACGRAPCRPGRRTRWPGRLS